MSRFFAIVLALAATALLALVVTGAYSVTSTYGFSGDVDPFTGLIVLMVAAVAVLMLLGACGALGRSGRATAVLAVGLVLAFVVGTYIASVLGGAAYDRQTGQGPPASIGATAP